MKSFEKINTGFNETFQPGKLSLGVVVPIENYATYPVPKMEQHLERVKLVERLGFKALWIRDVPFHVPFFGDAGQTYDPFSYLGFLAGQSSKIALGIASIALPLHHPVHVAKSAATIDQLSGGRLILGLASGDRPSEYPAMGISFEERGDHFRDAFTYLRKAQESFPEIEENHFGTLKGDIDILPKAVNHKIPLLITGHSRQSIEWNAGQGDGWMYYPRNLAHQKMAIDQWRSLIPQQQVYDKPFMQPLYIDLLLNDKAGPQMIHLGLRLGTKYLIEYLKHLQSIGVNHVALNLRFNSRDIEETLVHLSESVLPHFHSQTSKENKYE